MFLTNYSVNSRDPRSDGMCTLIIMDTSGSMVGDPILQAVQFIQQFINGLEEIQFEFGLNENVALAVCGSEVQIVQHLTHNYALVRRAIDTIIPEGASRLDLGVFLPVAAFSPNIHQNRRDCVAETNGHHVIPRVILISDGYPSMTPDEQQATPKEHTMMLHNMCFEQTQNLVTKILYKMYCVPVGEAHTNFLELVSSSTGGGVIEVSEARRASRCYLHHYLVGQLSRDGVDISSRAAVTEAVKHVVDLSEETDVEGVMEIIAQGEPDLSSRDAQMTQEAQQLQALAAMQQQGQTPGSGGIPGGMSGSGGAGGRGQLGMEQMMAPMQGGAGGEAIQQMMPALLGGTGGEGLAKMMAGMQGGAGGEGMAQMMAALQGGAGGGGLAQMMAAMQGGAGGEGLAQMMAAMQGGAGGEGLAQMMAAMQGGAGGEGLAQMMAAMQGGAGGEGLAQMMAAMQGGAGGEGLAQMMAAMQGGAGGEGLAQMMAAMQGGAGGEGLAQTMAAMIGGAGDEGMAQMMPAAQGGAGGDGMAQMMAALQGGGGERAMPQMQAYQQGARGEGLANKMASLEGMGGRAIAEKLESERAKTAKESREEVMAALQSGAGAESMAQMMGALGEDEEMRKKMAAMEGNGMGGALRGMGVRDRGASSRKDRNHRENPANPIGKMQQQEGNEATQQNAAHIQSKEQRSKVSSNDPIQKPNGYFPQETQVFGGMGGDCNEGADPVTHVRQQFAGMGGIGELAGLNQSGRNSSSNQPAQPAGRAGGSGLLAGHGNRTTTVKQQNHQSEQFSGMSGSHRSRVGGARNVDEQVNDEDTPDNPPVDALEQLGKLKAVQGDVEKDPFAALTERQKELYKASGNQEETRSKRPRERGKTVGAVGGMGGMDEACASKDMHDSRGSASGIPIFGGMGGPLQEDTEGNEDELVQKHNIREDKKSDMQTVLTKMSGHRKNKERREKRKLEEAKRNDGNGEESEEQENEGSYAEGEEDSDDERLSMNQRHRQRQKHKSEGVNDNDMNLLLDNDLDDDSSIDASSEDELLEGEEPPKTLTEMLYGSGHSDSEDPDYSEEGLMNFLRQYEQEHGQGEDNENGGANEQPVDQGAQQPAGGGGLQQLFGMGGYRQANMGGLGGMGNILGLGGMDRMGGAENVGNDQNARNQLNNLLGGLGGHNVEGIGGNGGMGGMGIRGMGNAGMGGRGIGGLAGMGNAGMRGMGFRGLGGMENLGIGGMGNAGMENFEVENDEMGGMGNGGFGGMG